MKTAPPAPRKSQPRSESTVVKTWVKPTSTYQSQSVYRGTAWPAPARMMNPKRSQRPTRGGRRPFATASLHPPARGAPGHQDRRRPEAASATPLGSVSPGGEIFLLGGRELVDLDVHRRELEPSDLEIDVPRHDVHLLLQALAVLDH